MKGSFKQILAAVLAALCILGMFAGCSASQDETAATTLPTETTQPFTTEPTTVPEETTEPIPAFPDPDFPLQATHAFVYDTTYERMYFSKGDPTQRIAPASLTKLYSAWVALQFIDPKTVITVGEEVTWIDPDSSIAFMYLGQQVTAEQCVEGMLLNSGNDASYILAVATGRVIAGDPALSPTAALGLFVGKMNELALELGLENTHFANPDGIDTAGHFTSLQDLYKISCLALETPLISKYAATVQDDVTYVSGETATWKNTNWLLHEDSDFYCEAACGLKTGSTTNAGKCLISAFRKEDGGYWIIGTLGCPEEEDRYIDTLHLYQHYTGQPIVEYETQPTETE